MSLLVFSLDYMVIGHSFPWKQFLFIRHTGVSFIKECCRHGIETYLGKLFRWLENIIFFGCIWGAWSPKTAWLCCVMFSASGCLCAAPLTIVLLLCRMNGNSIHIWELFSFHWAWPNASLVQVKRPKPLCADTCFFTTARNATKPIQSISNGFLPLWWPWCLIRVRAGSCLPSAGIH